MMRTLLLSGLLIAALAGRFATFAQEKGDEKAMTDADLELKLVAKTSTYKVPSDWRGDKLKEKLAVDAFPEPPAVDLELQVHNKGKAEKTLRIESDAGRVELTLEGPGAVSAKARRVFTREFRIGKVITLKPGEMHVIPVKQLSYGFRGVEWSAYWTEPGDYTLRAKLITPIDAMDSTKPGKLELTSNEIKLKVEE